MSPQRTSLQSAFSKTISTFVLSMAWIVGAMDSVCRLIWRALRRLVYHVRTAGERSRRKTGDLLSGPVKQFVAGPLRVVVLGRRADISLLAVLLAPVLALAAAWWVNSTVGYETLVTWVRGTWFGTNPSLAVFAAAGALIVLGSISAAVNSGLLPTSLLVSAPVFGAAVTRYGTTVTYTWGSEVVSLPNAVGIALLIALSFGVPIAVTGFLLGILFRRIVTTVSDYAGPASPVESP